MNLQCTFCKKIGVIPNDITQIIDSGHVILLVTHIRSKIPFRFPHTSCLDCYSGSAQTTAMYTMMFDQVMNKIAEYNPVPIWIKQLKQTTTLFHNDIATIILQYALKK
jgi:hypothetical protein